MVDQDRLRAYVRDALRHLYDYRYLENHPLAQQLWPQSNDQRGPSRAQRLNRLLLESIEAINPPTRRSKDHTRVRYYLLLVYRYVEERPVDEILRELGYSRSEFFRDQREAIAMLTSVLYEKVSVEVPRQEEEPAQLAGNMLETEAKRVLGGTEPLNFSETVNGILPIIRPLAEQRGVKINVEVPPALPSVLANRTLLRQVLIELFDHAISDAAAEHVQLVAYPVRSRVTIEIVAFRRLKGMPTSPQPSNHNFHPSCRLVQLLGGEWLGFKVAHGRLIWKFDLPALSERVLLMIEDSEALVRAFRGYLADYGYKVVTAANCQEALRIARELQPVAITLDVLLPSEDGWDILLALKRDPMTRHIPVIVCSVLDNPHIAHSLGAAVYLPKPVTRSALVGALEQLVSRPRGS